MRRSGYPAVRFLRGCLPIKYYNVCCRRGHREPLQSRVTEVKRDKELWADGKNKQGAPDTSSCYLSPLEQLRFATWTQGPITLPAAATLNRGIQISCSKIANNYLFIGRWGEEKKGLSKGSGGCWWIEALVRSQQQETADTRVSFYTPASWDASTTRFQAWPHGREQTPPWKGMQITRL